MKLAILLSIVAAAAAAAPPRLTFNRDIAPILFKNCAPCHRPGEAGPFPLLSYRDARKRANQIAAVTATRYMPPWLPEPGFAQFAGERRLSDRDIDKLRRWAAEGAPEGNPSDLPPVPKFAEGWQLGAPDLILTAKRPYRLRAGGGDTFRNLVFEVPGRATRYVKAIEIRPGNKRIVHHANLLLDRSGSARRRDGEDGEPGFPGMELRFESDFFDPDGHFLFWKPGTMPWVEPDDMAWRLDGGADLVLNLHLQPSGKPELIQPVLGLYFTAQAPTKFPMLLQLEHDGALDIPPGERDFVVTDSLRLPEDVDVLGVYPHAHYLGKDLEGFATLPDGARKWLIKIRHWDLNWQGVYRYAQPVFLPAGTVISMRYSYDNSEENPRNPSRPPRRVAGGNRSEDEMGHLWLEVLPRGGGDRRAPLQEVLMRRRLEKYPGDFTASLNLGAVLLNQGRSEDAVRYFGDALSAKPDDATALNSLGAALLSAGRPDDAIAVFRRAVARQPDYVNARYNLAVTLAGAGRLADALPELRQVVTARPDDAAARSRLASTLRALGAALASEGRLEQAIPYFRDAVDVEPRDADVHSDLGTALARRGDFAAAAAQFEIALRIDPRHAVARKNLQLLRARRERATP